MQEIVEKNKCCGCHACFDICPKDAISMKEDEKGFKYPYIDQDKCIDCGLCKKVCPVLNVKKEKKKDIKAYACYNKKLNERLESSSGGIFILLAKEILKRKGVVFGAAFDEQFNVKHIYVEKEKELKKLMKSKYTQSTIGDSYRKAKEFLDNDRYVLFTGTPCQIEGLKSYLKKDYEKLYTQDIICHGVPSPKAWDKYLKYQEKINKEKIKDVSFRNKDNGWKGYQMKILFETKTYSKSHSDDLFMKAFLKNICLRDSCYNCSFKKKYRVSDITLGDYWGIYDIHPEMNDDKGISVFVASSNKGQELFNKIKGKLEYKETNLDDAIKYNFSMIKSADHHKNEKKFIDKIDNMKFNQLITKYIPKQPKKKKGNHKIIELLKKIYHKSIGLLKRIYHKIGRMLKK